MARGWPGIVVNAGSGFMSGAVLVAAVGFDMATGERIVTMDADLQHPPEFIPRLVAEWEKGFKITLPRLYAASPASQHHRALGLAAPYIRDHLSYRVDHQRRAARHLARSAGGDARHLRSLRGRLP